MNIAEKVRVDIAARAHHGTYLYLLIWVGIGFWIGVADSYPSVFFSFTAAFFLLALARTNLQSNIIANQGKFAKQGTSLTIAIIATAFVWGAASAWIVLDPHFDRHDYLYMIISTGFAMGGTATLSISKAVRIWYPLGIFLPLVVAALYLGQIENYGKVVLMLGSLFYIWKAGEICARDYHAALENQALANKRALELEQLSVTDALTRLPNRAHFETFFSQEWQRCSRLNASISVFMIDLDNFKALNDNYSHVCGDHVLQQTAACIRNIFSRTNDTVNRYGGEEFVAVTSGTSVEQASILAERVVATIRDMEINFHGEPIKITCSVGVATGRPTSRLTNSAMLLAADQALYQAKRNGKSTFESADLNKPTEVCDGQIEIER